jgi:hypothetical protein
MDADTLAAHRGAVERLQGLPSIARLYGVRSGNRRSDRPMLLRHGQSLGKDQATKSEPRELSCQGEQVW